MSDSSVPPNITSKMSTTSDNDISPSREANVLPVTAVFHPIDTLSSTLVQESSSEQHVKPDATVDPITTVAMDPQPSISVSPAVQPTTAYIIDDSLTLPPVTRPMRQSVTPMLSFSFLHRLARHRFYPYILALCMVLIYVLVVTLNLVQELWDTILVIAIMCFGAMCEMTRVDRRLGMLLLRKFDYYYLLLNVWLYVGFGTYSQKDNWTMYELLPSYVAALFTNAWVITLDACPTVPKRIRILLLVVLVLNAGRVFAVEAWYQSTHYEVTHHNATQGHRQHVF